jgi:hypothetical protein
VALSRENRVGPQKTAQNLRGAVCDLRATQLGGGTRWGSPEKPRGDAAQARRLVRASERGPPTALGYVAVQVQATVDGRGHRDQRLQHDEQRKATIAAGTPAEPVRSAYGQGPWSSSAPGTPAWEAEACPPAGLESDAAAPQLAAVVAALGVPAGRPAASVFLAALP